MKKNILSVILIMILAGTLSGAAATKTTVTAQAVSLQQYIRLAAANDPHIQAIRQDTRSSIFSARTIQSMKDLLLSGSTGYNRQDPITSGTTTLNNADIFSATATLSKKFPSLLGAQTGLTFSWNNTDATTSGGPYSRSVPSWNFNLSIPVLANVLGKQDRLSLQNMHLQIEVLKKSLLETYETYIITLQREYLNWSMAVYQSQVYAGISSRAWQLLQQTLRKSKLGMTDQADISLARQNHLKYYALYQSAKRNAATRELAIRSRIMKSSTLKTGIGIEPENFYKIAPIAIKEMTAVQNNRLLQIGRLQLNIAENNYRIAKNATLPTANLVFRAGNQYSSINTGSTSYDQTTVDYFAGINFSLSLQNRDKKMTARANGSTLKKTRYSFIQTQRNFITTQKDIKQTLHYYKLITGANTAQVSAAYGRLAAIQQKYTQGRATLQNVTDARDGYASAVINDIEQRIAYRLVKLEALAFYDRLLTAYREYL